MPTTVTTFPELDYSREFMTHLPNARNGQMIRRPNLASYINLGTAFKTATEQSPTDFRGLGRGTESSAIAYNLDKTKQTDIWGNTETRYNKSQPTQNFEPSTARVGSKLHKTLLEIMDKDELEKLSMFEILVVKRFWSQTFGDTTYYYAELHKNCAVGPREFGGSDYLDMPLDVDYSNDKILGWASIGEDENGEKIATFYEVGDDIPGASVSGT